MRRLAGILPLALLAASAGMGALLSACGQEQRQTISISADPETFPTMKTTDVTTMISDSGYTRYQITTPLWLMFEEAKEPHWNFPDGIFVIQYDNNMKESGTFTADTAYYQSLQRIWRFDRNVRMHNVRGDVFLTQQLFWDQVHRKLYSDSFIHIERQDRIIEGYGFESDEQMNEYTIRRPTGIFPTSDFVHGSRPDTASVPKPAGANQSPQSPQSPQPDGAHQSSQSPQSSRPDGAHQSAQSPQSSQSSKAARTPMKAAAVSQ